MRIISKEPERTCVCSECHTQIGYYVEELLTDARYESFIICPVCEMYVVFKKRPPLTPQQIAEYLTFYNGSGAG